MFYQENGYFTARTLDHTVTLRNMGGGKFRIPLFYTNKPGIRADITIPVEEGRLYKLRKVNYVGVKLFRVPESLTPQIFQMAPGDVFSTAKLRKGIERMRDLYGSFGYIDFVPGAHAGTGARAPTRSISRSTWMRASSSTSAASIFRATPRRATK